MKLIKYGEFDSLEKVIMLGFFDSMHIGHRALHSLAKSCGMSIAVFTFTDQASLKDSKHVFCFEERLSIFENAGIDTVIYADFNKSFASTSAQQFLDTLNTALNVKVIVSGYDYCFGANALGNNQTITNYCQINNMRHIIAPPVLYQGEKASSTIIKKLLLDGEIPRVNKLLTQDYFIDGKVEHGRAVGNKLGFPTANIKLNVSKAPMADGVYAGYVCIDGKKCTAVINYGAKPTFGIDERNIEVHLINWQGDLYGKLLRVYFKQRLRETAKFADKNALILQLKKDCLAAKKLIDKTVN